MSSMASRSLTLHPSYQSAVMILWVIKYTVMITRLIKGSRLADYLPWLFYPSGFQVQWQSWTFPNLFCTSRCCAPRLRNPVLPQVSPSFPERETATFDVRNYNFRRLAKATIQATFVTIDGNNIEYFCVILRKRLVPTYGAGTRKIPKPQNYSYRKILMQLKL